MEDMRLFLREFDRKRNWNLYEQNLNAQERLDYLNLLLVSMMGELGEFANEVKKCNRDKVWKEAELKEELTDTFVYLLKIAMTLDLDLKTAFYNKMRKNEERFKHFIVASDTDSN